MRSGRKILMIMGMMNDNVQLFFCIGNVLFIVSGCVWGMLVGENCCSAGFILQKITKHCLIVIELIL